MKKKIYILMMIIILTTGCTCRYDLTIDNNTYKETITLNASTNEEINDFNRKWAIPFDKNNFYSGDSNVDSSYAKSIYKYKMNNNRLTFTHDFSKNDYIDSTAVNVCYKTLSISSYNGSTIISTSNKVDCFGTYPGLTNIVVNITVDKKVTNNNADRVSGNTYTWNINKNNAQNKGINLTFVNDNNQNDTTTPAKEKSKQSDYTMYIFSGILLIIALFIYFIFNNLKNRDDEMDD